MSETIIVTAMHRSGSSHIAKSICSAKPGVYYPGFMSLGTMGDDPHTLCYEIAQHHQVRLDSLPFIMHSHVLASAGTLKIIEASNIDKIVVVVRKIMDILQSVCVAHNQGQQMPNVHLPDYWKEWETDRQMMWLIQNFSPWLFAFYVTWSQRVPQSIMVNYRAHYADEKADNKRIFDYLGIDSDEVFTYSDKDDSRVSGLKPFVTTDMKVGLDRIPRSWGPDIYKAMRQEGLIDG